MLAPPAHRGLQEAQAHPHTGVEGSGPPSRRPSLTSLEGNGSATRFGSKSSVGSQQRPASANSVDGSLGRSGSKGSADCQIPVRFPQYSATLGGVLAPLTEVPSKRGLRLPVDIQHKAKELVQEFEALKGQTGPSVELCLTTAVGVLQHLCAVTDLDELAAAARRFPSDINFDKRRRSSGASVRGSSLDMVSSTYFQKVSENLQDELREEQEAENAIGNSTSSVVVEVGGVARTDTEEAQAENLPPAQQQPSLLHDVGSRRLSFKLDERLNDGEEITTSKNKCYVHPESTFRLTWDFGSMMLILILAILIPLEVSFFFDSDFPDFLIVVEYLIDIFFMVDIVLNFFTAYHEDHGISGRLVNHFGGIARHYAKGWLWIDIGAALPWLELIKLIGMDSLDSQGGEAVGMLKVLRYAKAARMMKVLRVLKLGGLMQVVEEKMVAAQSMTVAFQLLKTTVVMLVLSHTFACGWYAVAFFAEDSEAGKPQTWLQAEGLDAASGTGPFEQYVASFYFAITTGTTVGYGDIHPNNTLERAITVFVLVLSVLSISQFLGRVSQMVSSLRSLEAQMYQAKRDALVFMKKRRVAKDLQFRVLRYIEHVYETDAITAMDEKFMGLLSDSLQNQVALAVTGCVLKQFPLFEACEEHFLTAICQVCRTQRAGVGDIVVAEEQVAHEMYWLVRGEAAVFRRRVQIGALKAGEWFSELALFFPGTVRKATVRCEANCEFLVLHNHDFQKKVELFPNVRRECDKIAAELRRGNTEALKIALKINCPHCGATDHVGRDCTRCSR